MRPWDIRLFIGMQFVFLLTKGFGWGWTSSTYEPQKFQGKLFTVEFLTQLTSHPIHGIFHSWNHHFLGSTNACEAWRVFPGQHPKRTRRRRKPENSLPGLDPKREPTKSKGIGPELPKEAHIRSSRPSGEPAGRRSSFAITCLWRLKFKKAWKPYPSYGGMGDNKNISTYAHIMVGTVRFGG